MTRRAAFSISNAPVEPEPGRTQEPAASSEQPIRLVSRGILTFFTDPQKFPGTLLSLLTSAPPYFVGSVENETFFQACLPH